MPRERNQKLEEKSR